MRARRAAAAGPAGRALHDAGRPRARRRHAAPPAPTRRGPARADEFQLRAARARARGLRARFVRCGARGAGRARAARCARAPRGAGASPARPPIITRSRVGRRQRPAAQRPLLRPGRSSRSCTTPSTRTSTGPRTRRRSCSASRGTTATTTAGTTSATTSSSTSTARSSRAGPAASTSAIVGAQAQGFNSVSTGVACLGTFTDVAAPAAALDAIARADRLEALAPRRPVAGHGHRHVGGRRDATATPPGTPVTFERISGHRDGNATSCPGDVLYAQLPDLRTRAAQYAGPLAGVTAPRRLDDAARRHVGGAERRAALRRRQLARRRAGRHPLRDGRRRRFSPIATVRCAADGQCAHQLDLPHTGHAPRALPRRRDARAARVAARSTITVVPTLAMALSSRRIRRGRRVAVSGVVSPAPEVSRRPARAQGRAAATGACARAGSALNNGRYLRFFQPTRRGLYRVTVRVPGAPRGSTCACAVASAGIDVESARRRPRARPAASCARARSARPAAARARRGGRGSPPRPGRARAPRAR